MDRKRAEAAAVFVVQVSDDQLRQPGVIGPRKPLQEQPPPIGVQLFLRQPYERRVLEAIEIRKYLKGPLCKLLPADHILRENHRQVRLLIEPLALMVEGKPQPADEKLDRLLG